jgi:O-antigen/teichoic acid export membrane protein
MSVLKKLAGQTAIYGVSSILARTLNFLLTPFYALIFLNDQFGIITEMYAYVAFLVVLLTYGMETAYFRYATRPDLNAQKVYSNTLYSLTFTTTLFILLAMVFSQEIANWLRYPNHEEYIVWFALIVGLDAIASIPLAKLRKESRAKKFAVVNLINIGINIGFNIFFFWYCKGNFDAGNSNWLIDLCYNPEVGVGYVFIANLIASIVKFIILVPEMDIKGEFDMTLLKGMLKYAYPMLFVGLAGIVNEMLDRTILKEMLTKQYLAEGTYPTEELAHQAALSQLGIYGGNYKIAMSVMLFLQAFRYAAEPFFFNQEKEKDAKKTYAKVMNLIVIAVAFFFLIISLNLQIFKYFIPNPVYWEGLVVVPILLFAYVFYGIYINQSIWYKLSNKTHYGTLISVVGAIITVVANVSLIPIWGYVGCAWATLFCYAVMVVFSYYLGQQHYPIPYNLRKIALFLGSATLFYFISWKVDPNGVFNVWQFLYNNALVVLFILLVFYFESSLKNLLPFRKGVKR